MVATLVYCAFVVSSGFEPDGLIASLGVLPDSVEPYPPCPVNLDSIASLSFATVSSSRPSLDLTLAFLWEFGIVLLI